MDTEVLWGGTLSEVVFDPTSWTLRGRVRVVTDGTARDYVVLLEGVSEVWAQRAVPLPWTYAELTEVHVSKSPAGNLEVELVLWDDSTGLTARWSQIRVNPGR